MVRNLFSYGMGSFSAFNKVNDPRGFLMSGGTPNLTGFVMAEFGLKNNYYLEAGLSLERSFNAIITRPIGRSAGNTNDNIGYGNSGGFAFTSKKLSVGISKRLTTNKTNFNLFNLHAGIAGSFHYNRLTDSTVAENLTRRILHNPTDTSYFYYEAKGRYFKTAFPTVYFAVEKDFRLTNCLYLSAKYRRDFGLVKKVYEEEIYYYKGGVPYSDSSQLGPKVTSSINGSSQTLTLSIKYKFLSKKYRPEPPVMSLLN